MTSRFSLVAGNDDVHAGHVRTPSVRMGTRHVRRSRGLVIVLVVAFAGCGSSHDDRVAKATPAATTVASVQTAVAPSHATFVRALDATCRESGADLAAAANAAGDDTDRLAPIAGSYAKRVSRTLEQQAQLAPPERDRPAFRRYLAAQHRIVGVYQRMAAALHRGDVDQTRYLLDLLDGIRADRTKAAVDLGLRRCGA